MSNSEFELVLILATMVRTTYYTVVYGMIYKEIKVNEKKAWQLDEC